MTDQDEALRQAVREFARLASFTPAEREFFDCDDLVQTRVSRQARKAAEAATPLMAGLRAAHPDLPWDELAGWAAFSPHPADEAEREAAWQAGQLAPRLLAALVPVPAAEVTAEPEARR